MSYTRRRMARYLVVYEKSGPLNYGALSTDLPGVFANGSTLAETQRNMRAAMAAHIEALKAEGREVPAGRPADETAAGAEMVDVDDSKGPER